MEVNCNIDDLKILADTVKDPEARFSLQVDLNMAKMEQEMGATKRLELNIKHIKRKLHFLGIL